MAFSRLRIWAGRQVVVEDHDVGVGRRRRALQLVDLALADVGGGVGRLPLLQHAADDRGAGGFGQARELVERIAVDEERMVGQLHAHQDGGLALDALLAVVG